MRHAKAEPYATTDHARRLTDRGRADASAAGAYLATLGIVPDHAVVSSAERTTETWAEVARATGAADVAQLDAAVYAGGVDVVLEALRTVPPERSSIVYVGHNPTAAYLAHLLDDGEGEQEAVSGMLRGFPPSAMVVLEIGVAWADLGEETGRVVAFWSPPPR